MCCGAFSCDFGFADQRRPGPRHEARHRRADGRGKHHLQGMQEELPNSAGDTFQRARSAHIELSSGFSGFAPSSMGEALADRVSSTPVIDCLVCILFLLSGDPRLPLGCSPIRLGHVPMIGPESWPSNFFRTRREWWSNDCLRHGTRFRLMCTVGRSGL